MDLLEDLSDLGLQGNDGLGSVQGLRDHLLLPLAALILVLQIPSVVATCSRPTENASYTVIPVPRVLLPHGTASS
jgi:hypothetical protein